MTQESENPSRPRPRIEGLSDMIFGLALSVGAITLVGNPPTNLPDLVTDLSNFAFSFLILIAVWMRYTKIMSVLPLENRWTVSLNTLLLFLVSIEPFLFNLFLHTDSKLQAPYYNVVSIAYATDLGSLMLILGFFTTVLADEQKKLIPKDLLREFTFDAISFYFSGIMFFVSSLIPLSVMGLYLPLRFDLWVIPFIVSLGRRRGRDVIREIQKHNSKPGTK